ncbi:MAG: hypothetical protein OEV91_04990 [Desulfobulbaceae bacterium]|nr:hypothetical protein [Desulfobulbaceae bacterium]
MKKKLVSLIMTALFLGSTVGVVMAATLKCEVKSVDGTTVVIDCGSDAGKLKAGDTVNVKSTKKKQAIEGC